MIPIRNPFFKNFIEPRINFNYENQEVKSLNHTNSIYKYNNLNYRSEHDYIINDKSKKIMFLGCSMTEGVGVEYEHTWPKLLIDKFNGEYKNYNLAFNGCGNDYIFRILYQSIDLYNPNLVIILWSTTDRKEYYSNPNLLYLTTKHRHENNSKKLLANELRNHYDDFYYFLRNLISVETLLEHKKIPRVYATWENLIIKNENITNYISKKYWLEYNIQLWWEINGKSEKGLDNAHPGKIHHKMFSNKIYDKIIKEKLI